MQHERANPTNEGTLILLIAVLSPFELVLLGTGVGRKRRGSGKAATVKNSGQKCDHPLVALAGKEQTLEEVISHWCKCGPGSSKFEMGLFKSERLLGTSQSGPSSHTLPSRFAGF